MRIRWTPLSYLLIAAGGCAMWNADDVSPSRKFESTIIEDPGTERVDAVVRIEVFQPVNAEERVAVDAVLASMDSTVLPVSRRTTWDQNGLSVGRLDDLEPLRRIDRLRAARPSDDIDAFFAAAGVADGRDQPPRNLSLTAGRDVSWPTGPPMTTVDVPVIRRGDELFARRLDRPQYEWSLSVTPNTEGVRVTLSPGARHGTAATDFVPSRTGAGMRMETARPLWSLDDWSIDWDAERGDVLVIAGDGDGPMVDRLLGDGAVAVIRMVDDRP